MTKKDKTAKTALIIMILTLGSKFLGFIRESLIAAKFGSGTETDTLFVAMGITVLLTGLISTALNTTLIPILAEIEEKEGKEGKISYTNNIINVVVLVSILLIVITWILTPLLVRLNAKGFYGQQFDLAIKLTRIGLPTIIFSGIIGSLTGYLQSEQRHISSAAIGYPLNFLYIFYLLFLSSKFGIKGLIAASVLAVVSQLLIQIPEARRSGFRYKFIFNIKDNYIRRALSLSVPVLIGVAINDLNAIVDRTLASDLIKGSISALNYADKLNGLVLGVFVSAITTVIFPLLSKESSKDNMLGLKSIMSYGVKLILLITIPATVGIIVLGRPIVQVAFERGAFTPNDTIMTSSALIFYALGLVAYALRLLVTRVYYSLQDTKTPMINGIVSVGFNIVLNLILVQFMAHRGLALATSIATSIATLLLFYGLKKKIGSLGTKEYVKTFIKAGLASIIMGLVAYISYNWVYSHLETSTVYKLISLLVAMSLSVIVYIILCYVFKIDEVRQLINKARTKLPKNNMD